MNKSKMIVVSGILLFSILSIPNTEAATLSTGGSGASAEHCTQYTLAKILGLISAGEVLVCIVFDEDTPLSTVPIVRLRASGPDNGAGAALTQNWSIVSGTTTGCTTSAITQNSGANAATSWSNAFFTESFNTSSRQCAGIVQYTLNATSTNIVTWQGGWDTDIQSGATYVFNCGFTGLNATSADPDTQPCNQQVLNNTISGNLNNTISGNLNNTISGNLNNTISGNLFNTNVNLDYQCAAPEVNLTALNGTFYPCYHNELPTNPDSQHCDTPMPVWDTMTSNSFGSGTAPRMGYIQMCGRFPNTVKPNSTFVIAGEMTIPINFGGVGSSSLFLTGLTGCNILSTVDSPGTSILANVTTNIAKKIVRTFTVQMNTSSQFCYGYLLDTAPAGVGSGNYGSVPVNILVEDNSVVNTGTQHLIVDSWPTSLNVTANGNINVTMPSGLNLTVASMPQLQAVLSGTLNVTSSCGNTNVTPCYLNSNEQVNSTFMGNISVNQTTQQDYRASQAYTQALWTVVMFILAIAVAEWRKDLFYHLIAVLIGIYGIVTINSTLGIALPVITALMMYQLLRMFRIFRTQRNDIRGIDTEGQNSN